MFRGGATKVVETATQMIQKTAKENFMIKIIKNNTGYSVKNLFMLILTLVGVVLLLVPVFILIIEAWYNHTIQTDLTALAAYITSVTGIFVTAGITKAWSEKYERRLPGADGILGTEDDIIVRDGRVLTKEEADAEFEEQN